jgi:hypothetical protein
MFVDSPDQWSLIRSYARQNRNNQISIASIVRADANDIYATKLKEIQPLSELPSRTPEWEERQILEFEQHLTQRIAEHGDERVHAPDAASVLTENVLADIEHVKRAGGDPYQAIYEKYAIPRKLLTPDTTLGEIGTLAVYIADLNILGNALRPPAKISPLDIPPESMPSFVLQRRLLHEQHNAVRVSGSDFGDNDIAPLAFYIDALEVDKRTHDQLRKICCRSRKVADRMRLVVRSKDYSTIPQDLAADLHHRSLG